MSNVWVCFSVCLSTICTTILLEIRQVFLIIKHDPSYEWILLQYASVRQVYLSTIHDPSYEWIIFLVCNDRQVNHLVRRNPPYEWIPFQYASI